MNVVSDVITLVPIAEQAYTDCASVVAEKTVLKADAATCYNDAVATGVDVYNLVEDIIHKNTTGAILSAINAVSDVTGAIGACAGV